MIFRDASERKSVGAPSCAVPRQVKPSANPQVVFRLGGHSSSEGSTEALPVAEGFPTEQLTLGYERHSMFERIRKIRKAQAEGGFTLIELLVVIIILGILAAVVVFAVGGVGDKGKASACKIDTRTLRTAEEAYSASTVGNGNYGTEAQLVSGGFLSEPSVYHDLTVDNAATPKTFAVTIQDVSCGPTGTTAGTVVNGTTIF